MNSKKLNMVFLGCGNATRMHSKTLAKSTDINRYYASRDAMKAKACAKKYNGAGAFGSYDDAVSSNNIDVVFIATPPVQHLQQTLAALTAGKHVIIEKPPFLTSSEFAQVKEKQAASKRQVMIAENYYYKPLAFQLRRLLQSGVIGDLLFVHINALKEQKISGWRADPDIAGGGALFEGGIHWVNFVANLGPQLTGVRGYQPAPVTDFEKSILITMQYENGPVGTLYYSWETPSLFKGLRISKIYGRKGSITFESNGLFILVRGEKTKLIFPGLKDIAGYKQMFEDFFDSIRGDKQPQFTTELAARDLSLIEEIYTSRN
jgi:predicted dehydrogenase